MIITLCGTTRFIESFHEYNLHLTLAGHTVFTVATSVKGDWQPTPDEKRVLDLVHLSKIDVSDAIFVIDREFGLQGEPKTYIGESTLNEMRYATIKGKEIYRASNHGARQLLFNNCQHMSRAEFSEGFNEDRSNFVS